MKSPLTLLLTLALLSAARSEAARFFRVVGPVASTITAFSAEGYVTWTNASTNATFTVQTASSLLSPSIWEDYIQVPATNSVTTQRLLDPNPPADMVLIPAGSFTMGNCMATNEGFTAELPLHTVYVSALYMDKYEVTKALWDQVYLWATNHAYSFEYGALGKGATHPAQSMTWYDAAKWCNARSEMEGRLPAYYTSATQTTVYRSGVVVLQESFVKWNAGYRLPTEAEWEKAARSGASGHRFPWTDADTITHSRANYNSSTNYAYDISPTRGSHPSFQAGGWPFTSPVGYFAPNAYSLYDITGNVWEWCWDGYLSGFYSSSPGTDPRGPVSGSQRVLRGGGWFTDTSFCRTANRDWALPSSKRDYQGFRSVLSSQP